MKGVVAGVLLVAVGVMLIPAEAGHEMPYYPSFYPQEIRFETMTASAAAAALQHHTLHGYLGSEPLFRGHPPADVRSVISLGSYLVATFNQHAASLQSREKRCAVAHQILANLAQSNGTYVFHPYPITPYHGDYLQHFDLVQTLKATYLERGADGQHASALPLRIRSKGTLAKNLVPASWQTAGDQWDVTLETIDLRSVLASHTLALNGWLGPPWLQEGWFHAYLLLADTIRDQAVRSSVEVMYQRLMSGAYAGLEDKFNLERGFVSLLRQECGRVVVGYTLRREFVNVEYAGGVENIAYDAITGLHSPIFLRTVKLKDFPWNGWLRLGVDTTPTAAWNPIGGFTDTVGRLIWYAVGDLALFPAPYSASWTLDRIANYQSVIRPPRRAEQVRVMGKP